MQAYFAIAREHLADLPQFERLFASFWQNLLASHPDTAAGPVPSTAKVVDASSPMPRHARLVVLDDFFPNLLTGFRVAEYNEYLKAFPNARILSCLADFDEHHAAYAALYPEFADRVQRFAPALLEGCDMAYLNFIDNAGRYLPHLTQRGIPFVMTLYPGGGFGIGFGPTSNKLRNTLASKLLRGVITTQKITAEYLVEFANAEKLPVPTLHDIPGVVANPMYFEAADVVHQPYFGEGKPWLDLCFIAEKYMPRGLNKCYPEWVAAIHALSKNPQLRFHVVGSFSPDDIDVSALGDRLTFHGRLETSQLRSFLSGMDVVVSLSLPGALHPGNFDGFPTGSAVEASLCGVAIIASDVLGQNPGYGDGESMAIVPPLAKHLTARVNKLLAKPRNIAKMARAGQALTRRLYAPERQIAPRMAVLEQTARELGLELRA
jgi:lipopolysaccharide transport system ATP-binding protein